MRRSLSLLEVIIVFSFLAIIAPMLANKIPQWRAQYGFSQDRTVVEAMLFDAQLLAVLTSQTTQVQFIKEPQGLWKISLEPFSQMHSASQALQKRHVLSETQSVAGQEVGPVVVEFSAPFGDTAGLPLLLHSFHKETQECGLRIRTVSTTDKTHIFNDSLLNALEN